MGPWNCLQTLDWKKGQIAGQCFVTVMLMLSRICIATVVIAGAVSRTLSGVVSADGQPRAVPTFHCIGLYWSPVDGALENRCVVRYRPVGSEEWRQALPLWFDAREAEGLPVEHHREYRGSIVDLTPGTNYEIELFLERTQQRASLRAQTWGEHFPIGETEIVSDRNAPLIVDKSGSPEGYVLYTHAQDHETVVIDVRNEHVECVYVSGSHVILRGLTLRNAQKTGIRISQGCHDIVIEDCDISGWGEIADDGLGRMDWAIHSREPEVARVIVQRNFIHHPRGDTNTWREYRQRWQTSHPIGPQAVGFLDSEGNHVIRYNTIWSDDDHQFNDIFGAGSNYGVRGFPNRDSDIYGNLLSSCWDDAIESEGANCNVRIWGNYSTECFVGIACASTSVGPLYLWRNVCDVMRIAPGEWDGVFLKTGNKMGGGRIFVFHNTILQPVRISEGGKTTMGALIGLGCSPMLNVTSRNNILHARSVAIRDRTADPLGDYDYDLYTGEVRAPDRHETHGVQGVPIYVDDYGMKGDVGLFWLSSDSPGYDGGARLPNINDGYYGVAPDIGAHESHTPVMEFGVNAYTERIPSIVRTYTEN